MAPKNDPKKNASTVTAAKPAKKERKKRDPAAGPVNQRSKLELMIQRPLRDLARLVKGLTRANVATDAQGPLRDVLGALQTIAGPDGSALIASYPAVIGYVRQATSRAIVAGSKVQAKPSANAAFKALGERVVVGFTSLGSLRLEGVDEPVPADSFIRVEFYNQAAARTGKPRGSKVA
jgi:hypothetical protein